LFETESHFTTPALQASKDASRLDGRGHVVLAVDCRLEARLLLADLMCQLGGGRRQVLALGTAVRHSRVQLRQALSQRNLPIM
jgi:hypothetical protein